MPLSGLSNQEQAYWSSIGNLTGNLLDELKKGGWLRNEAELAAPDTQSPWSNTQYLCEIQRTHGDCESNE